MPKFGMELPELKMRVYRDRKVVLAHSWKIECPLNCSSLADGINPGPGETGWPSQEIAMRVADRHWREHEAELELLKETFKPAGVNIAEMLEAAGNWVVKTLRSIEEALAEADDVHAFVKAPDMPEYKLCTHIIEVDGVERQCGETRDAECHL